MHGHGIFPGVRSGAVHGRGMEQAGGAPGLYDAPPLGTLPSCSHVMLYIVVGCRLLSIAFCM